MPKIITRWIPDRNPATRTIIAVDGEGWNIPLTAGVRSANRFVADRGWHSYVMVAAADDKGFSNTLVHDGSRVETTETQARNYGLSTRSFCEFFLDLPYDATVISFYFSYDESKGFADLPLANMRELTNENPIPQDEYERRVKAVAQEYMTELGFTDFQKCLDYVHKAKIVDVASTVYDGYVLAYTPRKKLVIKDLEAGRSLVRNKWRDEQTGKIFTEKRASWKWNREVTIWDAYGFFQKSFVKALEDYRCGTCAACTAKPQAHCLTAPWSVADLERIRHMKENRGEFDPGQSGEIESYCIDECRYLAFLARDLLTHIHNFGLTLKRYDGTGAIAAAWLDDNHIKDYLPHREVIEATPEYMTENLSKDSGLEKINARIETIEFDGQTRLSWNAKTNTYLAFGFAGTGETRFSLSGLPEYVALCAYFGGRFEITEIGYMGRLYGYDINSAYPHILRSLPCLAHGHFERVSEYVPGAFGVYLAGSRTSGKWAPFPFRTTPEPVPGMARDAIYYCHGGQRWVWQDELRVARKHFGADAIPVYDGWVWVPACDHKPFAKINDLYLQRQQFVKDGNGVEKVIKLILNSLYGKTAQSIGWHIVNGENKPPPYQCFIWAGMITSGCRAMIYDAIRQPGADVVSSATDGILSRTPIPALENTTGKKVLGEWDADIVDDGYLFQSGVYCYIKTEKNPERKRTFKTRGFSAKEIPASVLIDAWRAGIETVHADPEQSRFIPMKSGVLRENALDYIGQWIPSEHDVSFTHNRRIPVYDWDSSGDDLPDMSGIKRYSEPHIVPDDLLSAPYEPKQTWEDVLENQPVTADDEYLEVGDLPSNLTESD